MAARIRADQFGTSSCFTFSRVCPVAGCVRGPFEQPTDRFHRQRFEDGLQLRVLAQSPNQGAIQLRPCLSGGGGVRIDQGQGFAGDLDGFLHGAGG
jgi:hypothetical protein